MGRWCALANRVPTADFAYRHYCPPGNMRFRCDEVYASKSIQSGKAVRFSASNIYEVNIFFLTATNRELNQVFDNINATPAFLHNGQFLLSPLVRKFLG
jgi:hypothetical protein